MKKIGFIIILAIISLVIFQQCQKNTQAVLSENTSNTQFDKVLQLLKERGITTSNSRDDKLEYRNAFCYQNDPDSCYDLGILYDTVFIPNVCNEAAVQYHAYWCPATLTLNYTDFHATPLEPACKNIWDWWQHLYDIGHLTEMSLAIDSFEYAASKSAEENLAYAFLVGYNIYCPNNLLSVNYHIQLCYQHCVKYNGKGSWPRFDIFKVDCGVHCCTRTREFCLNPDGSMHSANEDYEEVLGECGPDALNSSECQNAGGILIGDCERECGPPPTN